MGKEMGGDLRAGVSWMTASKKGCFEDIGLSKRFRIAQTQPGETDILLFSVNDINKCQ
jgi:hypothetical protein